MLGWWLVAVKSLCEVFKTSLSHPRAALIVDDTRQVWRGEDRNRVHTVLKFDPYHNPEAEVQPLPQDCRTCFWSHAKVYLWQQTSIFAFFGALMSSFGHGATG